MNDVLKPSEWPCGAPSPTYADGSKPPYRVVVDQRRPGGKRWVFTFRESKTLSEFRSWLGCYYHPESEVMELDAPTTGVYLDTLQPNGTYLDETLKAAREPTFAETVNPSRAFQFHDCTFGPGPAEPSRNPEPMKPDPLITDYYDEEIRRMIVGQSVVDRETLYNAAFDLTAGRREKVIANAVSEQATGGPNPNPEPHLVHRLFLLASRDPTVREIVQQWKMGRFPSFESAVACLAMTLMDQRDKARAEIVRLTNERTKS